MKIAFYFVDAEYIEYLKNIEMKSRGFTTVPNVHYANRDKFVYGVVLAIHELNYFVPVSSYIKKKQDNILIRIKEHKKEKIAGSLRFNFMIPIPKECLIPFDFKTAKIQEAKKVFVEKEYRFCRSNLSSIQKQALRTYYRVVNKTDEVLLKNSCDFKLLEKACESYTDNMPK